MKKLLFVLSVLLLTAVPANAMVKTADSEYYFHMRRVHGDLYGANDHYESITPALSEMREDTGIPYGPDTTYDSSNKKVLDLKNSPETSMNTGDTDITFSTGAQKATRKLHVFSLKLKPISKGDKKAVIRTEGNLKGCVLSIKIGKKEYRKTVSKKNQVLKFKIRRAKTGQKLIVKVTKGKEFIYGAADHVYSKRKIQKRMSKSDAKKTWEYCFYSFNEKKTKKQEVWTNCDVTVILKNNKVQKVRRR